MLMVWFPDLNPTDNIEPRQSELDKMIEKKASMTNVIYTMKGDRKQGVTLMVKCPGVIGAATVYN